MLLRQRRDAHLRSCAGHISPTHDEYKGLLAFDQHHAGPGESRRRATTGGTAATAELQRMESPARSESSLRLDQRNSAQYEAGSQGEDGIRGKEDEEMAGIRTSGVVLHWGGMRAQVDMLTALSLHHDNQMGILRLDTAYMFFLRTDVKGNMTTMLRCTRQE